MPRTSRPLRVHPIVLRRAEVVGVVDITPSMRRITLGGADLRAGTMGEGFPRPPFVSDGFDDHVKLVFPPARGNLPPVGTQQETRFAWNAEVLQYTRDYTVRGVDDEAGTFDIDVVRHDRGLAAEWAYRAQPGDQIDFAGPKSCAPVNHDVDWHLLIGDDTALPAIGRWLEEAPAGLRAQVIVEVPTAEDVQDICTRAEASVTWLVRGDCAAGDSDQLFEALRATELPEGRGYVWCAGEALTIAPIRRYLRQDLGLPKEDVEVVGYWRRPAQSRDARALDATMAVLNDVHEMSELLPPVVLRVAATLGIGGHVGAGATDPAALSAATGISEPLLRPLLDAMRAIGLLDVVDGHLTNTAHGAVLAEPDHVEELSLDNPANRQVLALVDLLDVLRTGEPSSRRASSAALLEASREQAADELYYVLEPLGRLPEVAGADRLTVVGPTADLAAPAILAAAPRERAVEVLVDPLSGPWSQHDCAVLLGVLDGRSDVEAAQILQQGLKHGRTLVVVERNNDQAASDDHTAERVLTDLALTGTPPRSKVDLELLLREAGATRLTTHQLGWGFGPFNRAILAHG